MDAGRDSNNVPTALAILDSNGTTIIALEGHPSNHTIGVSDATTGSDLGPTRALRDSNFVTTLMAVSEADGTTLVPLYADIDGKLLIDST